MEVGATDTAAATRRVQEAAPVKTNEVAPTQETAPKTKTAEVEAKAPVASDVVAGARERAAGVEAQARERLTTPTTNETAPTGAKPTRGLGQDANGRFGDARTGASGALADATDVQPGLLDKLQTLRDVDSGKLKPDPESRLGAYEATKGYPPGTVGHAVHNAIGTIYGTFGTFGEEKIGRVFNSPEAKALYNQPVDGPAGKEMARLEHQYWENVRKEDPWSPGANMGSTFSPGVRDWLQRKVF